MATVRGLHATARFGMEGTTAAHLIVDLPAQWVRCDFDQGTGRIIVLEPGGGTVEIFMGVEEGARVLREALAAFEQELATS